MRKFTEPHMLIHVVLGVVGVFLLLAGYSGIPPACSCSYAP
jgi:hypothetical protein